MVCSDYLGNPDAGSWNWFQSTRLELSAQRSVHMGDGTGVHLQKLVASHLLPFAVTKDI